LPTFGVKTLLVTSGLDTLKFKYDIELGDFWIHQRIPARSKYLNILWRRESKQQQKQQQQ
jgi:hypothetical protein